MSDPEAGGGGTRDDASPRAKTELDEVKGEVAPVSTTSGASASAKPSPIGAVGFPAREPITGVDARKRMKQTAIGIAPPALGSKAPPEPKPPEPKLPSRPPVGLPSRPPPSLPSGAPSRPPVSLPSAASRPPPGPASKPPPASAVPPAPITSPSVAPAAKADHPLAATTRSEGAAAPAVSGAVGSARKIGGRTLIGTAPPADAPAPIVPRRRTPAGGMPAFDARDAKIDAHAPTTALPAIAKPPSAPQPPPATSLAPPVIRVPQGGMLGSSAPARSARSGTLLCELLIKNGSITQEAADKALSVQEERGGQIGRILVSLGACNEEAIARALIEQLRLRKDIHWSDISAAAREQKDVAGLKVLTSPTRTVLVLLLTDAFSLLLAALIATAVHWARTYSELGTIDWTAWLVVGPAIVLSIFTFLGLELYSPLAKSTPDEIRDFSFATSLVHLMASLLSTLGDLPIVKWGPFVRGVWWLATLFLVPVIRALVRNYLSVQPWWGIPVVILGAAKTGRLVVRTLKAQPRSGLKPVMLLDDDLQKHGTLRASFTNEQMNVYSVNVSSGHYLTEQQRAELSHDIFGDDLPERGPISSDHIPVAPVSTGAAPLPAAGAPPPPSPVTKPGLGSTEDGVAPPSAPGGGIVLPENPSRSQLTKLASQFPRGKFAEVDGVPVIGELSLAPILAQRLKIPYAVVAMPGVDSPKLLQLIERIGGQFSHLLIIPDLFGFATMGVPAKSLGGILGVEVRQQLLLPGPRLAKRCMDVALTCFGGMFVAPFLFLIALLIKLDSKGPVFYTQKRLGKDGRYFDAYKFRTMHGDGEARLKAILDADPALRAEYDIYHKLRKDPRVTRIGRVLRKFSLDEFPQLLNVVKGDMSLVGPRPYIERELTEMGGQEQIILRAPPGMTGMWQVSDRNATSFAQRVQIDVYYVRNWSPWLDIHILAKTFGVVVKGSGV